MNSAGLWMGLAGLLLTAHPARAEPTACDLMTKADVEAITGMTVKKTEMDSLKFCAGMCEAENGTRCTYIGTLVRVDQAITLEFELPPYHIPDPFGVAERMDKASPHTRTMRMTVGGLPALWEYGPGGSSLHIIDGDTVHFRILQTIVASDKPYGPLFNDAASLAQAQALYARIRQHYDASAH